MSSDLKPNTKQIIKARKLLWQSTVSKEKAKKILRQIGLIELEKYRMKVSISLCVCGHKRKHHSDSYSVNFTGGCCAKCKCMNFMQHPKAFTNQKPSAQFGPSFV